jgi:hypothetical protein
LASSSWKLCRYWSYMQMFSGNINAQGAGKGALMFSAPLPPFYTPFSAQSTTDL